MNKLIPVYTSLLLFFFSANIAADSAEDKVADLLKQDRAPTGVVFEIAGKDEKALTWVIPRIQEYIVRLRKRFPGIEAAVVTHGREQFSLQKKNAEKYSTLQDSVRQLANEKNVPVHICQTFAGWKGVAPEEFPEYVTVSATGPQQVRDYVDLGYTLIRIR